MVRAGESSGRRRSLLHLGRLADLLIVHCPDEANLEFFDFLDMDLPASRTQLFVLDGIPCHAALPGGQGLSPRMLYGWYVEELHVPDV